MTRYFADGFEQLTVATSAVDLHVVHGGSGPPLLLLHGFPQTHVMWRDVARRLASSFRVVCPDLRGYGDSGKPASDDTHAAYAKRAMAGDMVELMSRLGFDRFDVAGHDRGGRVTHRLALDHPQRVRRACVLDIAPTLHMFMHIDRMLATAYYHWFFLIQPDGLPERMIGADPACYLRECLRRWSAPGAHFDESVVAEYVRCYANPATIHASCEDYRAAASIDLVHDEADRARRIECPLLVLWGARGVIARAYDVLAVWRDYATDVRGGTLDCGHFLPEERPAEIAAQLSAFFGH